MGESGESAANLGRLGSQPREVKTHSVVLRSEFLSAKTHEGCQSLIG